MKYLYLLLIPNIVNSLLTSFPSIPVRTYIKSFKSDLNDIKVTEPYYTSKKNTTAVIFYTGGSGIIISDIYSNFIDELAVKKMSVYPVSRFYNNHDLLIETLSKEYNKVVVMGHSSGATTAINKCKNNSLVNNLILLDGVDTRKFSFFNKRKRFDTKYVNSILFLNAGKSYKWTFDPPGIPFIPFLSLKKNNFLLKKNCKITHIQNDDFGHSDILDRPYSNLMHRTRLSVGYKNRSLKVLGDYHIWLANIIYYFCNNKLSDLDYIC